MSEPVFNIVFEGLTRGQAASLMALTKDLGHERLVTSIEDLKVVYQSDMDEK